jgi:hydroxymethylpyrimidine pyrophosphatase-like HAD family hydrolase
MMNTYDPRTLDALDELRELVKAMIQTGRHYWTTRWTLEELEAMKVWLDGTLADRQLPQHRRLGTLPGVEQ